MQSGSYPGPEAVEYNVGGGEEELESQPLSGNQDTPCPDSRDARRLSMTAYKVKRAGKRQPNSDSDDDNDKISRSPMKDDGEKIPSDIKERDEVQQQEKTLEKEEVVKDRDRSTVPEEVPDNVQREHVPVVAQSYVESPAQTVNIPENSKPPKRPR